MDSLHDDGAVALDALWDDAPISLPDVELGDGGHLPPPPEEPGPGRRPRRGPSPEHEAFSARMTLVVLGLMLALFAVQAAILSAGASGGPLLAYALSAAFGLVFLLPFVVGAIWFGRRMHPKR